MCNQGAMDVLDAYLAKLIILAQRRLAEGGAGTVTHRPCPNCFSFFYEDSHRLSALFTEWCGKRYFLNRVHYFSLKIGPDWLMKQVMLHHLNQSLAQDFLGTT